MPTKLLAKGLAAPKNAAPKRAVKLAPEGVVTAIVAVTGVVDAVEDLIVPGAFSHTLTVRRPKVVDDHEWGRKAGRVLHVEEWMPGDPRLPKRTKDGQSWPAEAGALVATMQYNLNSAAGRESYEWVRFYAESNEAEFSIGYKVPDGKARKRRDGVRVILMVDLFEFSHVLFGAAPLSMALDVKSQDGKVRRKRAKPPRPKGGEDQGDYSDVEAPDPSEPWEDDDDTKLRARTEAKTAASVLLEAKGEGGLDRNRGNAEDLRNYWLHGAGAAKIAWGTPGDFRRCVTHLSEHMTPEDARGYCQLRHKESTGMWTGDREHLALSGKSANTTKEVKAMSRMKGSYEERIALIEEAARELFEANSKRPTAVMPVATYGDEVVLNVYQDNDCESYLVGYEADSDGKVSLAEPQKVELSLVAEPDDGDPYEVSPEEAEEVFSMGEHVEATFHKLQDQNEGKAAAAVTEAKAANADEPDVPEGAYTVDNLPDDGWQQFRKTQPIEAMQMDEDFTVATREGVVEGSAGGWLAKDSDGYPYPIAADEFENVYAPAEPDGNDNEGDDDTDDDVDEYAPPSLEDDVEAPADELEDETAEKDADDEDDGETVTVDPDEHFALMDDLESSTGDEDEDE